MNLYNYIDYRQYLKDTFLELRRGNKHLSMREILRRIGCSSPSYYKEVVTDARKKMSLVMARKFAAFLKLDTKETGYFIALVGYNQAETESERISYYEELLRHKKHNSSENRFLELHEYEYLSSWELSAIREFLHFHDGFKNDDAQDRKKLADRFLPKLTEEQVKKAIHTLETLGFIKKDCDGCYRKTGQNIRSIKKTPAAYHSLCQNMKHALEIINKASPETRIFKNVVVSISSPAYQIIEKKIQEFCNDILDIVSKDTNPEDRLYSIGLQFFPITRLPEDEKK